MKIATTLLCTLLFSEPTLLLASSLELSLNKSSGVYEKGETIVLTIAVDSGTNAPLQLKIQKNNQETLAQRLPLPAGLPSHTLEYTLNEAGSLIFEARQNELIDTIGIIVAPNELQPSSERPQDFDTYWEKQKEKAEALPLQISKKPIDLEAKDTNYEAFDVSINSIGPQSLKGIFAKPANAVPGSLPIVIQYRAAGVKGEWCRAKTHEALGLAKRGGGALALDTNAHGMLNHEDESYYQDLENGLLKNYWEHGNTDRNEFYFRFMYLRMLRSIEFMTQQPEWDGKRILVIGESQGGGQALAAAGLDPRVTAAVVTVPAMCDWGAPLSNRKGGWPRPGNGNELNPDILAATAYFDIAHLLRGSQAKLVVEIGLIDDSCPSTSIYAALNQASGEVTTYPVSYRAHSWPEGDDRAHWDENTYAAKNAFVDDYLK